MCRLPNHCFVDFAYVTYVEFVRFLTNNATYCIAFGNESVVAIGRPNALPIRHSLSPLCSFAAKASGL